MDNLDNMTLDELTILVREALSRMYTKLRNEHNFGYNQECHISSIGSLEYDVNGYIIDNEPCNSGIYYTNVWMI